MGILSQVEKEIFTSSDTKVDLNKHKRKYSIVMRNTKLNMETGSLDSSREIEDIFRILDNFRSLFWW